MSNLKDLFLLDPQVVFLNHASFGATPKPVFNVYQRWQRELERQPVKFLSEEYPGLDRWARRTLGAYLNASADDLAFVSNATTGINIVARSLSLNEGDEVLATNHEYGACDNIWSFICQKAGALYKRMSVQLPIVNQHDIVEQIWSGVTPQTRVIFLSHITSPTAQEIPVKEILRLARQAGIITVIDGAHAPGQIPLDLNDIDADFYVGNLHKWALSPKGAGFLYSRKEIQHMIEPLVVSWGWKANSNKTTGSTYVDYLLWQGTRDPSASLSVPSAIDFQSIHKWDTVREKCQGLLIETIERICDLTELSSLYSNDTTFNQMAVAQLPREINALFLKQRLWDEFKVEVPILEWEQMKLIRISIQGYNTSAEIDILLNALKMLLPQVQDKST